jgi:hypothetical protein
MPTPDARSALAVALLEPQQPVPDGWSSRRGSDAAQRLAVYRNNVVHSLVTALAETYPVCRRFIGGEAFDALAAAFVRAHPPHTPVLAEWGEAMAEFAPTFLGPAGMPAALLGLVADLARLEWARQRAWHAADAGPLDMAALATALAEPESLPGLGLGLHPSLGALCFETPAVSVWAAHQQGGEDGGEHPVDLGAIPADAAEAAWVLRPADEVLVLPVTVTQARWAARIQAGAVLGEAGAADLDLGATLALLLQHGALCALHPER